jgi:Fic family protein
MDSALFSTEQKKYLVKTTEGAVAFVPPPLPPKISAGDLVMEIAEASHCIGELNGAARRLPNPNMLVHALTRKEALTTSAMEGTITTIGNIVLEEAEARPGLDDDAREAFNYAYALGQANQSLETLPISHRVIKEAHENLLGGLSSKRGAGKRPGQYKQHQNAVGWTGESIHTARYVPPPPRETQGCMDQLETYMNVDNKQQGQRLIDLALIHYQFEAIHPFDDGNGRIGRMLITLLSQQMKLVELPLLHLSPYFEKHKDPYIDKLFGVSTQAKWNEWIKFFLGAIEESCKSAIQTVDRTIALQAAMKQKILADEGNHRLATIVEHLFNSGWTNAVNTQKLCAVTFPTAKSDLQKLVKAGILKEFSEQRPTIYYAPEIIALSER